MRFLRRRHFVVMKSKLDFVRSSHRRCCVKKLFLKSRKFYSKTPVLESLCKALRPATPTNRCFPVKFGTSLRTSILKNICELLLLFCEGSYICNQQPLMVSLKIIFSQTLGKLPIAVQKNAVVQRFYVFLKISQNSQENICTGDSFLIKLRAGSQLSSRSEIFCKIDALNMFTKFTEKQLCWSVFLINLQAFSVVTLL